MGQELSSAYKDEYEFKLLQKKIRDVRGVDCFQYKATYLKRRLAIRMRAHNIISYKAYGEFLDAHPDEYDKFFDTLTVNVTEFFRDLDTYDGLYRMVLPELIARKHNRTLKVWSAGCASGEEPYSIAILVSEALGLKVNEWGVQIIATDIDPVILARATKGVYTLKQVEGVKEEYLKKYFTIEGNQYAVMPQIKRWVRFIRENIMEGNTHPFMDIIFCRNMLIYLSKEAHKQVYDCFHKSLNEGGYLVVGNSEIVLGETLRRFCPLPEAKRIYQKIEV